MRAWQAWYGNEAQLLGQVEDNEKLVVIWRWVLSVRFFFRFVITVYGVWGLKNGSWGASYMWLLC